MCAGEQDLESTFGANSLTQDLQLQCPVWVFFEQPLLSTVYAINVNPMDSDAEKSGIALMSNTLQYSVYAVNADQLILTLHASKMCR